MTYNLTPIFISLTPILLTIIAISIAFLLSASYYFAHLVIYPKVFPVEEPYRLELEAGKINESEWKSWDKQEISITSPFGYKLYGTYLGLGGSQKSVVISHGITQNLYTSIKYVNIFRKRGFNVLLYDLRNHGHNVRKNTTFGYYEKTDLKAVIDWAFQTLENSGTGIGRVGTFGESLGASTSLQHSAIDPRIAFAIADCGYADLAYLLKYRMKMQYPLLPFFPLLNLSDFFCRLITGMSFAKVSPVQDLVSVSTPIMFIHGQNDEYIPPYHAQRMFDAKKQGIKALYLAPNARHAEAFWNNQVEYDQRVGDFLQSIGF